MRACFAAAMHGAYSQWVSAMRRGDFEAAWKIGAATLPDRSGARADDPALPYHRRQVWTGASLEGRDVLVRCYHGLGDTIQFARFLPALRERARSVTVEMQPRLVPLFLGFPGIDRLIPFDEGLPTPPPEDGCAVEMMELPAALRMRPAAVPPPYLTAPPATLPAGAIGLCWKGGDWDPDRSIPEEMMAPFARGPAFTLVGEPTRLPLLNPEGCPMEMIATAGLVAGAALVITIDTMIAHLAGAMGKECWLLLRHDCDWRWAHQGNRSLWYPSLRLYRQQRSGDWSEPLARVRRDLGRRVGTVR